MAKANRKVIIFLAICIIFTIFMSGIHLSINKLLLSQADRSVLISKVYMDNELIGDRMLQPEEYGEKILIAQFDGSFLNEVDGKIAMVISRLRGRYNEIYINNHLIGKIGLKNSDHVNTWNEIVKFDIPRGYLRHDSNILQIKTDSVYKVGLAGFPIFIAEENLAEEVHSRINFIYFQFYSIAFGMLIAIVIVQYFIFSIHGIFDKKFVVFPIIVLLLALLLNDFTLKHMTFLTVELKEKLYYILLHSATLLFVATVYRYYKLVARTLLYITATLYFVTMAAVILSPNLTVLAERGILFTFSLFFIAIYCIYIFVVQYKKNKRTRDLMFLLSLSVFTIMTMIEMLSVIVDWLNIRSAALGYVLFSIGILIITLDSFRLRITEKIAEVEKLKKESEILKRSLYADELTGLYNHRQLVAKLTDDIKVKKTHFDILLIDIDKFNIFNDINGYVNGDEVLREIARIISDVTGDCANCFRYSDNRFAYLNFDARKSTLEIAENVRREVQMNHRIKSLNTSTPLTVSCGITSFPEDATGLLTVISNANKALQVAKKRGRNRVVKYFKDILCELEDISFVEYKQQMIIDFMYSLANVIDMKDKYTGHHSEEVSRISVLIGEKLGLGDEDMTALRLGSILHDFGKIGMPDAIINKKGKLTDEEYARMKAHPEKGYNIIKNIIDNKKVLEIIKYHHERYDGKGYPEQLKGEEIPYLARIVCVADAYHAMTSDRSYRKALSVETAVAELQKWRGIQFDSDIVGAFVEAVEEAGLLQRAENVAVVQPDYAPAKLRAVSV